MSGARERYGDIIDREHPRSPKHPGMPRKNRAAQFAPFAALTGYDDLIHEAARYTEQRIVLDENKKEELNRKLHILLNAEDAPEAVFTGSVRGAYQAKSTSPRSSMRQKRPFSWASQPRMSPPVMSRA